MRIRRQDDDYILTYKSKGLLAREEIAFFPLTKEAYDHLAPKTDGLLIQKTRYKIPFLEKYTIELDIFDGA